MSAPAWLQRRLAETTWQGQTFSRRALDYGFSVRCTDGTLARYLELLLEPLAPSGETTTTYSILDLGSRFRRRYMVAADEELVSRSGRPESCVNALLWHVNTRAVETCAERVVIHAAAAARHSVGIVLPAATGSGKTTLVTGLVRAGFDYLTDEAVALAADGTIVPYPKPVALERGSWTLFAELRPQVGPTLEPYLASRWYVDVRSIRLDSVGVSVTPGLIIAPRYVAGGPTQLEPMTRSEALIELMRNTIDLSRHGRDGFEALAAAVRESACYRLTVGDLDDACSTIAGLVQRQAGLVVEGT